MTQAFNLSQLANNVNTSGQLNAAAGLYNQVPVANGGTGVATLASGAVVLGAGTGGVTTVPAATSGNILTANGTTWVSQIPSGGTPIVTIYTSPSPWTKSPTLKAIKVTVVAGGGAGGGKGSLTPAVLLGGGGGSGAVGFGYFQAPAIAGPVTVTVGTAGSAAPNAAGGAGTPSSFGALVSCTGGGGGANGPTGTGGAGGTITTTPQVYGMPGIQGGVMPAQAPTVPSSSTKASANGIGNTKNGGQTAFGFGYGGVSVLTVSNDAVGYGAGGSGSGSTNVMAGGNGAAGIVIVEEFY